ncbi:hypothetical protein [Sphingobacterium psychroaquaticum]|uniref:Uncharacterized protein n=1 Tax=Sphingobacterium psychroaquaticum TaxID=561061 RepID=A0A1X7LDR7_9SPHI|nr:hypothetical protein [Sphingobacterium psychroaquaticum]SMG51697.1 hypothetical protein SAMN05660862_0024 [Sphingobacterium psychroaquaticum]
MQIISDYEELFKIKDFGKKRKEDAFFQQAFDCTYERLKNDLKNQYSENLEDKVNRWLNISKVQYFQDVLPISFYIQAKMLFRDGFYEASINISRSICEVICYEELSKQTHPFGDLTIEDKHSPSFNVLKQFLLLPKRIEKTKFQNEIVAKIIDTNPADRSTNFIKSSFELKNDNHFHLKLQNVKKEENLNRFFKIFKSIPFDEFETFSQKVLEKIEFVWSKGSSYVHVKKSSHQAKEDAFKIIDSIGFVLFELYGESVKENISVVSAYSRFEDVCTGVTYGMDIYPTIEDAHIGYYNLPTQKQKQRMIGIIGVWKGEWGLNNNTQSGIFEFVKEGEYINCYLQVGEEQNKIPMGITLYGDYFLINQINGNRTIHYFQLYILNHNTLVGQRKNSCDFVVFSKQPQ